VPNIPTETPRSLKVYRQEPELPLNGGEDGLGQIRRLLYKAETVLALGGLLFCSLWAIIGRNQAKKQLLFYEIVKSNTQFRYKYY